MPLSLSLPLSFPPYVSLSPSPILPYQEVALESRFKAAEDILVIHRMGIIIINKIKLYGMKSKEKQTLINADGVWGIFS